MDLTCKALYTAILNNRDPEHEELKKKLKFYEDKIQKLRICLAWRDYENSAVLCTKCIGMFGIPCRNCFREICIKCEKDIKCAT